MGEVERYRDGAVVSLWRVGGHAGAGLVNEVGAWNWNELVAPDLDRVKKFYGGVLGRWLHAARLAAGEPAPLGSSISGWEPPRPS
jgi:hypothetical protein